jgi:hypothetical protein
MSQRSEVSAQRSVTNPRKLYLICHFILPRRIDDARFHKIEGFNPRCHAHYLPVCSETELNGDVARWLTEAYAVGQQKR